MSQMRGQLLRLSTATVAILNGKQIVTIPAEAMVTVLSEPDRKGLVFALYDGRRVKVFEQDIRERGTLVLTEILRAKAAG